MSTRRKCYYNLEEANAMVPTLERYCQRIILALRELFSLRCSMQEQGAQQTADGIAVPNDRQAEFVPLQQRYEFVCELYDHLLQELAELGVDLADPEAGTIHFYSWCDGEEVVLSWQYGEPTVQYWCEPGDQSAERRPLRQLYHDVPDGVVVHH